MTAKFQPRIMPESVKSLDLPTATTSAALAPSEWIVSVFGSPGAGKTTALKARFVRLVESGIHPDQIAVIAATREAAAVLRDELALEYQGATSGPLTKTFSALAFSIVMAEAKRNFTKPPQLLSGGEQDRILAEILSNTQISWPGQIDKQIQSLKGFRAELRDLIAAAGEHHISPKQLTELSSERNFASWKPAAEVYEHYLLRLDSEPRKLDAAGLLNLAAEIVSKKDSQVEGNWHFKAVLIDDAQEITPAAARLVSALAKNGAGVSFFGDPDSATLGFRSSNPKAMTALAEQLSIDLGRKSEQYFIEPVHAIRRPEISAALARISAQIEVARAGRQRKGLAPAQQLIGGDGIDQKTFLSRGDELAYLARELRKRHLYDQVPYSKMAVVARSRETLEKIALALSAESVPIRIVGAQAALKHEHAAGELLFLASVCLSDEPIAAELAKKLLLSEFGGLDTLSLGRLRRSMRKAFEDYESSANELLEQVFQDPESLLIVKSRQASAAYRLVKLISSVRERVKTNEFTIESLLWELYDKTGLRGAWVENALGVGEIALAANRNLDSMLSLFAAAARYSERNPTASLRDFVDDQLSREVPEDTLALRDIDGEQVRLITPSGLIGKRFDTVAIPELLEGVWPNLKPRSTLLGAKALDSLMRGEVLSEIQDRGELSDELRMFYKTVGACEQRLIVTASDLEDERISQFMYLIGEPGEPQRFRERGLTLRSLSGVLRRELAQDPQNLSAALGLARLAIAGAPGSHPETWYGMLPASTSEPLTLEGEKAFIHPSQLDNFLKCPLHWFLDSHGGKRSSFAASLGTLLHEVMELAGTSEIAELEKMVDSRWHTLEFEADWLEKADRRKASAMVANLAGYLSQFTSSGGEVLGREEGFEFELEGVKVRGKVDRIEKLADGTAMIVDLKTSDKAPSAKDLIDHSQLKLYQMAFLENGFQKIQEEKLELAGAKLVIIGGDKLQEKSQPLMDEASAKEFKAKLEQTGIEMGRNVFVAQVDSHCSNEYQYGTCSLHLVRSVAYAD